MKLQPVIVTIHLLLGMTLLALLTWLAARQSHHDPVGAGAARLRLAAGIGLALVAAQIALGGWVSTNYAALACTDFPLCHGRLVPDMDFAQAFTLWRKLGMSADGGFLPFSALTAIHWTHRCFAFVVFGYTAWLAHRALRIDGLAKTARWMLIVIAVQLCTGMATVFLRWPLLLAVLHNGGAALLMLLTVMLNFKARLGVPARLPAGATARSAYPA
jgi:cytochrome c oxidase assembly protein subunit 15